MASQAARQISHWELWLAHVSVLNRHNATPMRVVANANHSCPNSSPSLLSKLKMKSVTNARRVNFILVWMRKKRLRYVDTIATSGEKARRGSERSLQPRLEWTLGKGRIWSQVLGMRSTAGAKTGLKVWRNHHQHSVGGEYAR
jgi:hypothetical protein